MKKLEEKQLIIKKGYKFNGANTNHYRLNWPEFLAAWKNELGKIQEVSEISDGEFYEYLESQTSPESDKNTFGALPLLGLHEPSKRDCTNPPNGIGATVPTLNREYNRDYDKDIEEEEKAKRVSPVILSDEEIENLKIQLVKEFAADLKERSFNSVWGTVMRQYRKGAIKIDFEGYARKLLNEKVDSLEARREKEAQQPKQESKPRGRSTRKEMLPEWFEEKKEQEKSTDAIDLEAERAALEKEMQIYKK